MKRKLLASVIGFALISGSSAFAAGVSDAMIEADAKNGKDVLTWGMGQNGQRFSTLTKINTKNVSKLVPAWSFRSAARNSAARNPSRWFITAKCSLPLLTRVFTL